MSAAFAYFTVPICDRSALAQGDQEDNCLRQVAFCVESCSKLEQMPLRLASEGAGATFHVKRKASRELSSSMPDSELPTK
jgi:hypothetical protein